MLQYLLQKGQKEHPGSSFDNGQRSRSLRLGMTGLVHHQQSLGRSRLTMRPYSGAGLEGVDPVYVDQQMAGSCGQ